MQSQKKNRHNGSGESADLRRQSCAPQIKREHPQRVPARRVTVEDRWKRKQEEWQQEKQLLVHLLELQDRHQQLIGFEIHDSLAQLLAAAVMELKKVKSSWRERGSEAKENLDRGCDLVEQSLQEARRLINGLRLGTLQDLGVVLAIDDLIYAVSISQAAPQIEFHHKVRFDRLPAPLENTIFRIVQESFANACRHSQSDRVRVKLRQEADLLHIEVRDWGVGFDPGAVEEGHFGLESIQERARLSGGRATIASVPGQGTVVAVDVPLVGA